MATASGRNSEEEGIFYDEVVMSVYDEKPKNIGVLTGIFKGRMFLIQNKTVAKKRRVHMANGVNHWIMRDMVITHFGGSPSTLTWKVLYDADKSNITKKILVCGFSNAARAREFKRLVKETIATLTGVPALKLEEGAVEVKPELVELDAESGHACNQDDAVVKTEKCSEDGSEVGSQDARGLAANQSQDLEVDQAAEDPEAEPQDPEPYTMEQAKTRREAGGYACFLCPRVFVAPGGLRDHLNSVHLGLKLHTCRYCTKVFGWASSRGNHERMIHRDQ